MAKGDRADRSGKWEMAAGPHPSEDPVVWVGRLSSGVSRRRPAAGGGGKMVEDDRRLELLEPSACGGSPLARLLAKLGVWSVPDGN